METMINSASGTDLSNIQTTGITIIQGTAPNRNTPAGKDNTNRETIYLSDIGKMIISAMRIAQDGDIKAKAFLSDFENGLESGRLNDEALAYAAPESLLTAMEEEGIDLREPLQKVADSAAVMLPSAA